jgi:hypothetical protein
VGGLICERQAAASNFSRLLQTFHLFVGLEGGISDLSSFSSLRIFKIFFFFYFSWVRLQRHFNPFSVTPVEGLSDNQFLRRRNYIRIGGMLLNYSALK